MGKVIFTAILLAITLSGHAQSNVVQVEYFLDTDNGFGMNTVLDITSPGTNITESILSDISSSVSIGYHKLYFRIKDSEGNWSHTIRKQIQVFAPNAQNNIVLGEYFINEDPGVGMANTFSIDLQGEDIEQQFTAQILETTPLGYHKLYGRTKDSQGNWSHTFRKNIEVYLNPDTNVVQIEYFFDDDLEFGNNTIVNLSEPNLEGTWSFNVPYPEGVYNSVEEIDVLFVRVKDSNLKWSITTTLDEVSVLSINDNLHKTVKVNPNPFINTINLEVGNSSVLQNIIVYDITGKVVFMSNTNLKQLDLGHLEKGIYILNLSTEKEKARFKIVKK